MTLAKKTTGNAKNGSFHEHNKTSLEICKDDEKEPRTRKTQAVDYNLKEAWENTAYFS